MTLIDDGITAHNSSWCAASTKEFRKERDGERERGKECEGEKTWSGKNSQPIERKRALGIFSMLRFVFATYSFLALLVT